MTEHVHEWKRDLLGARCKCGRALSKDMLVEIANEYETLKAAFTIAIHLLGHADFKNGNTDPGGTIDEGEVHACILMDKIKTLVPQMYADILEGKDE